VNATVKSDGCPARTKNETFSGSPSMNLAKTVSELVISKQSGQSNSLNQPSYSFSPQQNVQLTCYSCNFPGHKRKDCNWNGQFQPTPNKSIDKMFIELPVSIKAAILVSLHLT
jgi:hypothetical protein